MAGTKPGHQPLVSILINNYNYADFLDHAIRSALDQARSYEPVEIVVVDDGSTDHSRQIIKSYAGAIVGIFKENGGQASAFNAGVRASRGEIGETLRVYRPSGPVVALGRRDTRLPGSGDAVRLAREQGFEPVVRAKNT